MGPVSWACETRSFDGVLVEFENCTSKYNPSKGKVVPAHDTKAHTRCKE